MIPRILTIAGSDSSGGAGVQADSATIRALGAFPITAISCITSQNSRGFRLSQPVAPDVFEDQIEACFEDFKPDAVKIGMIPTLRHFEIICSELKKYGFRNLVIDPIKAPTAVSGEYSGFVWSIEYLKYLADTITLLTPNLPEALQLSSSSETSMSEMNIFSEDVCISLTDKILGESGVRNVLLKGGHINNGDGDGYASDYLAGYLSDGSLFHKIFKESRIETRNTHGTGCVLSSAIATFLAKGYKISDAVSRAKSFLHDSLERNKGIKWSDFENGHGPALIDIQNT